MRNNFSNTHGHIAYAPIKSNFISWAIIVTLLLAMPCVAANPADLVGYWVNEEDGIFNMELLGNGRGTFGGIPISWEANKNVFVLYTPTKETYYYQISGSVFVLIDGAKRIPFIKVTKAEFTKKLKEAEKKLIELAKKSNEKEEQKKKEEEKLKEERKKKNEEDRKRIEKLSDYFTDSRDGKKYRTVKIGTQTWMAENLNYAGKKDDIGICYGKKPENCEKYGALYTSDEAKKVCPSGWHLPSKKEWQTLINFAGGDKVAGKKLKATRPDENCKYTTEETTGRGNVIVTEHNECATDEFGFSALWYTSASWWEGNATSDGWWGANKVYCKMGNGHSIILEEYSAPSRRLSVLDEYNDGEKNSDDAYYSVRCVKD